MVHEGQEPESIGLYKLAKSSYNVDTAQKEL